MNQKPEELLRDLQNKIYHPLYLLEGEEPWYIDQVCHYIENNVLPEGERAFNQSVLYATREMKVNDIRQRAINIPMFSNYQVLIVKEAQMIKKWDDFLAYAEKPAKATMLVLCHKYSNFDKRTKVAKVIAANGVVMTTKKINDNVLPTWIHDFAKKKGVTMQPQATALMAEYIGNDLSRIANEFDKLLIHLNERKEITTDDIEKNIGISKEYNVFELNKAIGTKNIPKTNRIVAYLTENSKTNPLPLTMGSLYSYFSKIYAVNKSKAREDKDLAAKLGIPPYFMREYVDAAKNFPVEKNEKVLALLHEYDLRSKGVNDAGTEDAALLKELIFKILH